MKAYLVLADLWKAEPPIRSWNAEVNNGNVTISYKDLVDALEIMKGSTNNRLRLVSDAGNQLRTEEQLQKELQNGK